MKHLFLFSALLFSLTTAKGQICNFCSEEELKEALKEKNTVLYEKLNMDGEKCLTEKNDNYTKSWHFRYGQCYMYDITIMKKPYSKSMKKVLDSQFARKSDTTWEDSENMVEMKIKDGVEQFVFTSKFSAIHNLK